MISSFSGTIKWPRAGLSTTVEAGGRLGADLADYAGSVAVDAEGFIYVADAGNRRIQEFTP